MAWCRVRGRQAIVAARAFIISFVTKVSASTVDATTLDHVRKEGERVIIEDHGSPVAALVTMEDLRLIEREEDRVDNAAAELALQETGPNISWDEIKKRMDAE
jgi:antitoxin (DNA-binding transcriptional repressor) of toxin-antitoxin stability system